MQESDWFNNALCKNLDTALFFEKYEQDADMARTMDELCLSCPVIQECFESGCESNSWGVWGGVFLIEGKPDIARNAHKDKITWDSILEKIYG